MSGKEYKFKGFDWTELAECWGLKAEKSESKWLRMFSDEDDVPFKPVKVDYFINKRKVTFEVDEEDEILAEKIKSHIRDNLDLITAKFKDESMRDDIHRFLKALINESKQIDYNYPIYEAMLELNDDWTICKWVTNNLEMLWT